MRCYICKKKVTDFIHKCIKDTMDNLSEEEQMFITEDLNLIHCRGPKDMFDELGHTVICMDCFTKASKNYVLHGRKFYSIAHDEEIGTLQDVIDTLIGNFDDEMYDQGMIYTEEWYKSATDMVFHTIGMLDSFEYKPQLSLEDLEYIFDAVFVWLKGQQLT